MKKFFEAVSCWDNYAGSSRYGWVEEIGDPILYKKVRLLSPDELELLTLVVVDDFSQSEVAAIYTDAHSKTLLRNSGKSKNIFKKGCKKAVFAAYHMRGSFQFPPVP